MGTVTGHAPRPGAGAEQPIARSGTRLAISHARRTPTTATFEDYCPAPAAVPPTSPREESAGDRACHLSEQGIGLRTVGRVLGILAALLRTQGWRRASVTGQSGLKQQYRDASSLHTKVNLHDRFSTNPLGWHRWVFDHLELADGSLILEVGCGDGALWLKNAERIPDRWAVTLADFSPGMVDDVRRSLQAVGRRFAYAAFDAQAIPFVDGQFDAVIANHMLYDVPDRPRALAEIRRVLRPGGRLFASTAGLGHLRELHELTERFAPDRSRWAWTNDFADTFTLENGADQLRPWFDDVVLARYEDALRVTEAEPLVAYIRSSRAGNALTDESRRRLHAFIEEEIGARGAFHVAKDPGLFEAR